jgi:hypothetical protein
MNTFYFEMTDTFGGDLNYCWLKRFKINAKNLKGALIKLSRETGFNFRNNGSYYKAKNACIGAYELDFDHAEYVTENTDWLEKAIEL